MIIDVFPKKEIKEGSIFIGYSPFGKSLDPRMKKPSLHMVCRFLHSASRVIFQTTKWYVLHSDKFLCLIRSYSWILSSAVHVSSLKSLRANSTSMEERTENAEGADVTCSDRKTDRQGLLSSGYIHGNFPSDSVVLMEWCVKCNYITDADRPSIYWCCTSKTT